MNPINDELILSVLENDYSQLHIITVMVAILIPILAIILLVVLKMKRQSHAIFFAILPFFAFIFFIPMYSKFNALKYSIDNKCWAMITDTVIESDSYYGEPDKNGHRKIHYYVYLENSGRINTGKNYFLLKR